MNTLLPFWDWIKGFVADMTTQTQIWQNFTCLHKTMTKIIHYPNKSSGSCPGMTDWGVLALFDCQGRTGFREECPCVMSQSVHQTLLCWQRILNTVFHSDNPHPNMSMLKMNISWQCGRYVFIEALLFNTDRLMNSKPSLQSLHLTTYALQ